PQPAALGGAVPAPLRGLHGLLIERLQTLPEEIREALVLASATARPDITLPATAGGPSVTHHLETAERLGVVRIAPDGHVHFDNPLLRAAVYAEAGGRSRRGAHRAGGARPAPRARQPGPGRGRGADAHGRRRLRPPPRRPRDRRGALRPRRRPYPGRCRGRADGTPAGRRRLRRGRGPLGRRPRRGAVAAHRGARPGGTGPRPHPAAALRRERPGGRGAADP